MINYILIHYHEIALKGGNRAFFENQLKENIRKFLAEFDVKVKNLRGRILVDILSQVQNDKEKIKQKLQKIFGIANFSFCYGEKIDLIKEKEKIINEIKNKVWEFIKSKKFKSFKIDARRADKNFPYTSQEINEIIGAFVKEKSGAKVDLTKPELACYIEIAGDSFFIYDDKIQGAGGLPAGISGKVVSLISSGIDSPVASWFMARRGAKVVYVHFHSYPQTSLVSKKNVENLVKILNNWQIGAKIYFIPLLDIQKKVMLSAPEDLRVILYRRQMMKMAEKIVKKENALGLVTGDSLGQVASQTLENLNTVSRASDFPIYRPLIGIDKEEIINIAKKIGTYEISIKPYEDCCSLFTPKHPATKTNPEEIEKIEKNLELDELIEKAIKNVEIKSIEVRLQ